MTKPIERRLAALERGRLALPGRPAGEVVIYDVRSGQPVTPVRGAAVQVWIPDNRRMGVTRDETD